MGRVNHETSAAPSTTSWEEDRWYPVQLREWKIEAKGTPGYKGQPRRHPRLTMVWEVVDTEDWIWDATDLTVRRQDDGTLAKCALLVCALGGRDARKEATPWIDDESLEYGFGPDPETDTPAGRIVTGIHMEVRGEPYVDGKGATRLRVKRYQPYATTVATPAASPPMFSPDGRFLWNGQSWVPVQQEAVPAPVQQELI